MSDSAKGGIAPRIVHIDRHHGAMPRGFAHLEDPCDRNAFQSFRKFGEACPPDSAARSAQQSKERPSSFASPGRRCPLIPRLGPFRTITWDGIHFVENLAHGQRTLRTAVNNLDAWDANAEELWKMLQKGGVQPSAGECDNHGSCDIPRTMVDISGSPCQLWSSYGKKQRRESHLIILLLCWALWFRTCKVLVGILENVVGFDLAFLRFLLGDLYATYLSNATVQDAAFLGLWGPAVLNARPA